MVLPMTADLPIAGVANAASASAAMLLGFSGLMGGVTHYGAVLANWSEHSIERTTAVGFFVGLIAGAAVLSAEALS